MPLLIDYDRLERVLVLTGPPSETVPLREVIRGHGGLFQKDKQRWVLPATNPFAPGICQDLCRELEARGASILHGEKTRESIRVLANQPLPSCFRFRTEPRPFQGVGCAWLAANDGALLLDEMGLGKTKQVIDAVEATGNKHVVVVCPNTLKESWRSEIEKHGPESARYTIAAGSTRFRALEVYQWAQERSDWTRYLILNYEALRFFKAEFLEACKRSILVFDEAHRLKNARAQVTKIAAEARPDRIWMLTGTPIANRLEDLYSLCNLVRPGIMGWSWFEFERKHIVRDQWGGVKSYKNVEEVKRKLSLCSLRRTKAEVAPDLPPKIYERRTVDLSPEERKPYDQMKRDLKAWLGDLREDRITIAEAATFAARFMRLRQLADGYVSEGAGKDHEWAKNPSKIAAAVEAWEDAGRPRSVIWCQFVDVVKEAASQFGKLTLPWTIYGEVSTNQRALAVENWSKANEGVLVCQMDTAGEGLNLQAGSFEIFLDAPLTPKQRRQCEDRCHRIGQSNPVTIVDIVARNTVDEKILARLEKKMELADDVVDGGWDVKEAMGWL